VPVETPRELQDEPLLVGESLEHLSNLLAGKLDLFRWRIRCFVAVALARHGRFMDRPRSFNLEPPRFVRRLAASP
jgi:hypothetical protein